MATWHQQQAQRRNPTPLWHETKWTVVEDNGSTCISRFEASEEANGYLGNLKSRCKDKGAYILPPMQHQMAKRVR